MIKKISNTVEKNKRKKRKELLDELEICTNIEELKILIKKIIEIDNGRSI